VTAAVVVSSLGPPDVPGLLDGINRQSLRFFALNRDRPVVGRMLDRLMAFGARRDPDKFVAKTVAALPPADGDVMRRPAVARAYVEAVLECFRSGPRGAQLDTALVLREWGFDPSAIAVPVRLWHGERDTDVAPVIGRWLAEAIPGCRAEFLPDEGHISLIVNRAEAILAGP
jgi:pimeloyl-ACP methyl ester carboxylesterase